jgi:hypothetical protein
MFLDQSSITRVLHHLGPTQGQQLTLISELLLRRFGLWRQLERVDLDIDSTGLLVYGRTYEGRRKGYFPRQRGRWGYRMTVAATANPAGPEILALALDPANIGPAGRFWDCLYQAADVLGSFDRLGVIRADASWGTGRRHSGTRGPGTHLYRQGLLQSHRAPLRSPRSPHAVGVPGPLHSNLVTGGPTASPIAVISCPWCSLS